MTPIDGGVVHNPAPALDTDHSPSQHRGAVTWRRGDLLTMVRAVMSSIVMDLVPK